MDLRSLESFALRHHGLVTRVEAARVGIGKRAWFRAIDSGLLAPAAPNVARMVGAPGSVEARILAPILSLGRGVMASHRSAAFLWGAEVVGHDPVDLLASSRGRRLTLDGVVLHRPTDQRRLRPVRPRGVPATDPLRTLIDLGAVAPAATPVLLEHLIITGSVTRRSLERTLRAHARPGRAGVSVLRAAIEAWPFDDERPDSTLEREVKDLCRRHGLPEPAFHAVILGYEVDFAWLPERVILESDGWADHGRDRKGFARDRERDPILIEAGWVILRFTWEQIMFRAAWVAARLANVLRARGVPNSREARR
jgi:very-short-patch-repair endonuclease